MRLRHAVVGALVAGVVLVPATAASAVHHSAGKLPLALVPLQKAQLGPAGVSLALAPGSGSISNREAALRFLGISVSGAPLSTFEKLGRRGGYALDYGDPYSGSTGVMEIRSAVEIYASPAGARKGLGFWRHEDSQIGFLEDSPLLPVDEKRIRPAAIGRHGFAYRVTLTAPNLNPIVWLDEQVVVGRFVLDLTVTAGSEHAAERAVPRLLRRLEQRLRAMLAGERSGTPVTPLPKLHAGQALGGPDLSTMTLQLSDLGDAQWLTMDGEYDAWSSPLSEYYLDLVLNLPPENDYEVLEQDLDWWPSATEATYAEAYHSALLVGGLALRSGVTISSVDLSAVGDAATGYLVQRPGVADKLYFTLRNGQAGEFTVADTNATLQPSDVQSLAQAAAARLDAGLGP